MSTPNPDIYDLVQSIVRTEMKHYYAPMPARVVEYNEEDQTVNVQILQSFTRVSESTGEVSHIQPPLLWHLPVLIPATAQSDSVLTLEDGAALLLFITMGSLDELLDRDGAEPVDPKDPRQQSLQDAFAMPMRINRTVGLDPANGNDRVIWGDDVRIGNNPNDAEALAFLASVQTELKQLRDEVHNHTHAAGLLIAPTGGGAVTGSTAAAPTTTVPNVEGTTSLKGA